EHLRQVVKALEDLQVLRTEITNRQEATAPLPVKSAVCQQAHQSLLETLDQQLATLEAEMVRLAQLAAGEAFKLLKSIKGIGKVTASALIALCGSFEDFETASQVVAFAGLNPSPYQSGTSVRGRGGISKRGHATLRRVLYMGALTAMRFNPPCKALYQRLVAKGKSKKLARVAVAHKLLRIAFGVVKGGCPFDPDYAKN
ncbi:MAG TPA: IS110 family transposase, partial [Candidatus Obscuribacterales bacterium]